MSWDKHNFYWRQTLLGALVVLLTLVLAGCGDSTPTPATTIAVTTTKAANPSKISLKTLKFGAVPAENAAKAIEDDQPFAREMEKLLGAPVEIFVGNNYGVVIDALNAKKIDAALLTPFSYVLASDKHTVEAIGQQVGKGGATSYNSLIISSPALGLKTLADLKGHTFAFTDPASTSGYLMPSYMLVKNGLNPTRDLQTSFVTTHDAALLGVISGKSDAAAVASDVYEKLMREGKVKEGDVTILAKSDPIPNSAVVVRSDLSASDKAAIRSAILTVGNNPEAVKSLTAEGFKEVSDSSYAILRDIARTLNLDLNNLG